MEKKYLLSNSEKQARYSRLIAKGIDLFLVFILCLLLYPAGILAAIAYLGLSDSFHQGQSIGKRLVGFQVVSLEDGTPCSIKQSFIRNLPFLIPLFFMMIPLWGWFFSLILGGPLTLFEVYLLMKIQSGNRLGDVMASTTVMASPGPTPIVRKPRESWFDPEPAS
jgi:uncharacterized RDD family membrane protein YckC